MCEYQTNQFFVTYLSLSLS